MRIDILEFNCLSTFRWLWQAMYYETITIEVGNVNMVRYNIILRAPVSLQRFFSSLDNNSQTRPLVIASAVFLPGNEVEINNSLRILLLVAHLIVCCRKIPKYLWNSGSLPYHTFPHFFSISQILCLISVAVKLAYGAY